MKKKLSIFFLFFFLISTHQAFSNSNKQTNYVIGCNSKVSQNYLENFDNLKIKKIEVDTHNYRRWIVNSIRIITSPSRFTAHEFSLQNVFEKQIIGVCDFKTCPKIEEAC